MRPELKSNPYRPRSSRNGLMSCALLPRIGGRGLPSNVAPLSTSSSTSLKLWPGVLHACHNAVSPSLYLKLTISFRSSRRNSVASKFFVFAARSRGLNFSFVESQTEGSIPSLTKILRISTISGSGCVISAVPIAWCTAFSPSLSVAVGSAEYSRQSLTISGRWSRHARRRAIV